MDTLRHNPEAISNSPLAPSTRLSAFSWEIPLDTSCKQTFYLVVYTEAIDSSPVPICTVWRNTWASLPSTTPHSSLLCPNLAFAYFIDFSGFSSSSSFSLMGESQPANFPNIAVNTWKRKRKSLWIYRTLLMFCQPVHSIFWVTNVCRKGLVGFLFRDYKTIITTTNRLRVACRIQKTQE